MNPIRQRRRPMAEINVVPYIDVMLVLLIIFMITAPLLNLGVEIDLPKTGAPPLEMENQDSQLAVSVQINGDYMLTVPGEVAELVDETTLLEKVAAFARVNPQLEVLVGGDTNARYGRVLQAFVLLEEAGVERVGLLSDPPSTDSQ